MFSGVFTALVTPFDQNGNFDRKSFEQIVADQMAAGVDGIVVVGTTGENPTLSHAEDLEVVSAAIKTASGKIKVIAGTGSNSTDEAMRYTIDAAMLGADAALVVAPYYNKPTQKGLLLHFEAIAGSAPDFPILLYDVPGRTGVKIASETTIALARIPNIVGIKNATGNLADTTNLIGNVPDGFSILSGDDDLTVDLIRAGGHGVISVASNFKPVEVKKMVAAALAGDFATADEANAALGDFFAACFYESNPIPIKFLLAESGKCELVYRLPLCPPSDENQKKLRAFLK